MRTALNWMLLFSVRKFVYSKEKQKGFWFRLNFITLTLSDAQIHSDTYIVEHMLQPLLRWLQRQCGVKNYVWKAEVQDNGNIHFHITLDKFVHWRKLRNKWNELQLRHAYIAVATNAEIIPDPNSTDVHAVVNIKRIVSYITSYITKKDSEKKNARLSNALAFCHSNIERELAYMSIAAVGIPFSKRRVTSKVWGCNHSLANLNITLSEDTPLYYQAKQYHKDNYCKLLSDDKISRVYIHSQRLDDGVHPVISDALCNAYEQYMAGDDGIKQYQY